MARPIALVARLFGRFARFVWWLAGLIVVFALAGFLVAPPIVKSQAEKILGRELGRTATIEKVAINPFMPSLTVTGFNLREPGADASFVTFDELYVNASWTSLFRFAPVVDGVRLTRPHVRIARTGETTFNFSDLVGKFGARADASRPTDDGPARFAVYNIEILDGRVDVDDRLVDRKHEITAVDVGLPFISSLESHREILVEPRFKATVNGAPFEALAKSTPFTESRDSTLNLDLKDFDLAPLVVYMPMAIPAKIPSAKLDADIDITFAQPAGKAPTIVLSGKTALKDVAVDEPGGAPFLRLERLAADLRAIEPLARRFEIARIHVDAPQLEFTRKKGGEIYAARLLEVKPESAPQPSPVAPVAYKVDEIVVERLAVNAVDERAARPVRVELRDATLSVRNLASESGARATFDALLPTARGETVKSSGDFGLAPLDAKGTASIEGLVVKEVWPYVEPFLLADALDGRLDVATSFAYTSAGERPNVQLTDVGVKLANLVLRQRGEKRDLVRVAALETKGGSLDLAAQKASAGEVVSTGANLLVVRGQDGSLNLEKLLIDEAAGGAASGQRATDAKPWTVELPKATLDKYAVRLEDRTRSEPLVVNADPIRLTAEGLSTAPDTTGKVAVNLRLDRTGTLAASGTLGINPVTGRLRVDARNLGITPVQRFIDDRVNVTITSGTASVKGRLSFDLAPGKPVRAAFAGDLGVDNFASMDKPTSQDLANWKSLVLGGVKLDLEPLAVNVDEVSLSEFYSRLILNADGTLNLQHLAVGPDPGAPGTSSPAPDAKGSAGASASRAAGETGKTTTAPGAPAPPAAAEPEGLPPNVRIGKVTLQGGNINYSDFFVRPNYSANLTGVTGTVTEITPEKPGDVELRGSIDNAAPVEIDGRLNPLARELFLDIKASARGIDLPPLSPYSIKYAGYGIEKGKLSVKVSYHVEDRKLTAENNIYLDQLTFGEKVESPTATDLPVLLAVSLLQDRNGVIDINLPISGSLDDPEFSLGGIIVKVIVNLITKAITAPFALLASAAGGGEELSFIEFEAGRAALTPEAVKRLDALAKALNDRPGLKLDVTGFVDPATDREGLKHAYIDNRVKAQKMKALAKEGKAPASVDAVTWDKSEYPALLKAAYGEEKFEKPRNFIGLAKDLPVPEMEKLMLANAPAGEAELADLGKRRAQAARDHLVNTGKVASERVFLVAPRGAPEAKDKGSLRRAQFSVK